MTGLEQFCLSPTLREGQVVKRVPRDPRMWRGRFIHTLDTGSVRVGGRYRRARFNIRKGGRLATMLRRTMAAKPDAFLCRLDTRKA